MAAGTLDLLGQQRVGDGGGQGVTVDRLLLVGRRDRGDPAPQLGQPPAEVVQPLGGQDLQAGVVLVAAEHGGRGRERLEHEVQVLAGQLGDGVGHGHTLLSGGKLAPGRGWWPTDGSANSQVPFL
jgi:hypothetical protein